MAMTLILYAQPARLSANEELLNQQLTSTERAWLKSHPVIRVGIMPSWPPLNYVDRQGEPRGIGVDYINALNERLGGRLLITPRPFKESLALVRGKKIDALMDITPKKEREPFFNFTAPYITIPHVIVARKTGPYFDSERDLVKKVVALEQGFYNVRFFREKYPGVTVREYKSTSEALGAVSRGEADAYAGNRAVAIYLIEQELMVNLQVQGRLNKPPVDLSIGVRKDWPELAAILDKAFASITHEEKRLILQKRFGKVPAPNKPLILPEPVTFDQTDFILKTIAAVFLFVFMVLIIGWLFRRQDRDLSIRAILFMVLFIFVGLTIFMGTFVILLMELEKELAGIELRRYESIRLAYELKHSSDDLTRFARTFVITREPEYESYCRAILDIRNGVRPHPENYTPSYWEHVAGGLIEPDDNGELYSIEQKMIGLGFTEEEQKMLSMAKNESDGLTHLENIAMNAVKGLFKDAEGNFSIVKSPDFKMARQLLHGKSYNETKARSMKHIDDFFAHVEWRTGNQLNQVQKEMKLVIWVVVGVLFFIIFFAVAVFFLLQHRIVTPLYLLKDGAGNLEKGDYSHRINIISMDEVGDLARAFNTMADSIYERTMKLQNIFDTAVDAIIVISSKGIVHEFSAAAEKLFGYDAGDVIGKNVSILMPASDQGANDSAMMHYLKTSEKSKLGGRTEAVGMKKSGERFPISMSISEFMIGEQRFYTGILRDITERKAAEQQLQKLSSVVEQSPVSVMIMDKTGIIEYVNTAFTRITGYTFDETVGRNIRRLQSGDFSLEGKKALWASLLSGKAWFGDLASRSKNGRELWERAVFAPLSDETGEISHYVAVKEDITRQKLMEDARQSSLKLNQAADAASIDTLLELALEESIRLSGSCIGFFHFVNPDQQTIEFQVWSKAVKENCSIGEKKVHYPIDKAGVWVDCFHEKAPVIHNDYSVLDHRKGFPAGHLSVVRDLAVPVFEDNNIVAIVGVGNKPQPYIQNDIDIVSLLAENIWGIVRRKRAREIILKNEERMNLVLRGGNLGYWDTALETRTTVVNERWAEMLGYRLDEVRDPHTTWEKSLHPDDRGMVLQAGKEYLSGERSVYEIEYRAFNQKGNVRWFITRGEVVEQDKNGKPLRMVGTVLDITEQKETEQELRQNMDDLQRFSDIAIGREEKMIQLKQEINDLMHLMERPAKYKIVK